MLFGPEKQLSANRFTTEQDICHTSDQRAISWASYTAFASVFGWDETPDFFTGETPYEKFSKLPLETQVALIEIGKALKGDED